MALSKNLKDTTSVKFEGLSAAPTHVDGEGLVRASMLLRETSGCDFDAHLVAQTNGRHRQ
jgi:hypothetical protein